MTPYMITSLMLPYKQQEIIDFLETLPAVENWRASDGVVFVVTALSLQHLCGAILARFPGMHFLCVPLESAKVQGWCHPDTWDFINNPRPAPPENQLETLRLPMPPKM